MVTLTPELINAAWSYGELEYRYRKVQELARDKWETVKDKFLKFYLECNRRYGKSAWGLFWLAEGAIKNAGSQHAFFAPVKEGLRDYILPIIAEVFSDCPEDLMPALDAHMTLTFPNSSSVIFRGSNNQQHRVRRGNAFKRVFIDEARDVDDLKTLVDSVVVPSLFSVSGRLVIGSTPADSEAHDLYEIKVQAEREGWYHRCDIYECNKADPLDFPLQRIEQWKKETLDETAWQREYMALWVKDPTKTIIPEWSQEYVQVAEHDEFFPWYHKYEGMDLGVRDKTVAIFGYYDFLKARLFVESEFALQNEEVRTDRIATLVKEQETELGYQSFHDRRSEQYKLIPYNEKVYRRIADNTDPILMNDLNALHQLDFFATGKDTLPAMINMVREWVKDGRIIVSPNCKELIGCLKNAVWNKDKKDLDRSKTYGHFDALMALVYLVRNIDTHTNPIPKNLGKSWATHAIKKVEVIPPTSAYNLARLLKPKLETDRAREAFVRGAI